MHKKIIAVIGLLAVCFLTGNLLARRKGKRLKGKFRKANEEKKHSMHLAEMEKTILKAKEKTEEIEKYAQLGEKLINLDPVDDACKINDILTEFMDENKIPCPFGDWSFESFDKFMSDPNNKLTFR